MKPTTWIEIDQSNLNQNIAYYRNILPVKTKLTGVIKANGYGHGITQLGHLYDKHPDINLICVACSSEGITLRKAGVIKPILIMGYLDTPIDELVKYNLIITIHDIHMTYKLNQLGKKHDTIIPVHLKVDTGLSRFGCSLEQVAIIIKQIQQTPWLKLQGVYSHLSDSTNPKIVYQQELLFQSLKINNTKTHFAKSEGIQHCTFQYDYARIGIGLLGYSPGDQQAQQHLKPVLSLHSTIVYVKPIQAHTPVGYCQTYTTKRPTVIGIVAIGYYEGIDPQLANQGYVLVHGHKAPIIGKISMNCTTIDITDIPQAKIGNVVTLLGQDGNLNISGYDWSNITHYNIRQHFTNLKESIPRVVVNDLNFLDTTCEQVHPK